MTSYPAPPPGAVAAPAVPPVAWVIPPAAVLAVIGAVTPWFRPHGQVRGLSRDYDALYSIRDGKIGVIAPIALVVLALGVVNLMRGKVRGRLAASADPIRTTAKYALGAGLAALVCLVIAWFLVASQYKFALTDGETLSFEDYRSRLEQLGGSLSRGPQPGYWLTLAGAVLAIVAGLVLLVQAGPRRAAPPPSEPSR